jgi:hypothetical protein
MYILGGKMKNKRFVLAVILVIIMLSLSISMYGDIGEGDWTQEEINNFSNKEYKGNCTMYEFARKWVPPYVLPDLTETEFMGFGSNEQESISKLILIGKLNEDIEFRYLSLLRNEIYARNEYIFKDEYLKAFFNQMPWYKPISKEVQLNAYERYNVKKIKKLEKEVRAITELKEVNPDTFPERYKGRIVIDAKWGDEQGEYKLYTEGPGLGPFSFTIDNKENIYVLNHCTPSSIMKYNKQGKLLKVYKNEAFDSAEDIAIDSLGYIYVSTGDIHNNAQYHEILKYNQKTGKGESFWYAGSDQKINVLSFKTKILQNRILVTKDDNVILDTKEFYKRGERPLSQVNIDNMEVEKGEVVKINNAVDKSREVSINIPKIFNKMCEPIGVGKGNYTFMITYLGRDKNGNIFIKCDYDIIPEFRDSNIYHNTKSIVYKYTSSSKLISVIEPIQLEYSYWGMVSFRTTRVDRDGNVYFLRPDKEGLKIYKFEMR